MECFVYAVYYHTQENITTASSFNCRSQQLTLIYLNMSGSEGNGMCVKSKNLSMQLPNCKYFTAFAKRYTYIHRQEDGCARVHTHTDACIHAHNTYTEAKVKVRGWYFHNHTDVINLIPHRYSQLMRVGLGMAHEQWFSRGLNAINSKLCFLDPMLWGT